FVVSLELSINIRFLFCVRDAHGVGGGFGRLECIRHSEGDVLTVVTDDVIFKWGTPLIADAVKSLSDRRPVDLSDVLAMEYRSHAGYFLGCSRIEPGYFPVGDGRLYRHTIEKAGKMEVGGVLCSSRSFKRPLHAPRVAADG